MAYEDGEEEEAVPLEELFHELQARFAEISRDSPRSGAEMRFPSHEAPAGGGSSLQARLSGASSPTASRSPSLGVATACLVPDPGRFATSGAPAPRHAGRRAGARGRRAGALRGGVRRAGCNLRR